LPGTQELSGWNITNNHTGNIQIYALLHHIGLKLNIWMVVVSRASVKGRNYDRVGNSEVALEVEKAGDG